MLGANVLDKQSKEELLKQAKHITGLEILIVLHSYWLG
ncbi:DNA polymerase domain protein [Staphylococcus aureus]|nr:DNA polymerase domain protein [Staphylococcus aureus]